MISQTLTCQLGNLPH